MATLERPTCFKALSRKCIILQHFKLNPLLFTVKLIEEALSSVFVDGDICNKTLILKKISLSVTLLPVLVLTFTYVNLSHLALLKCGSNISTLSSSITTNTAGKCPDISKNVSSYHSTSTAGKSPRNIGFCWH